MKRQSSLPANPWQKLPKSPPYILREDSQAIAAYSRRISARDVRIHDDLFPEPFIGAFNAPVVLLNGNPGWSEQDKQWHKKPVFAALIRNTLAQKAARYPFYYLDPTITDSPGAIWWNQRLKELIDAVGSVQAVARGLLCVEFFPYHSQKNRWGSPILSSQSFNFALVRNAMHRGAVVVIMRKEKAWCSHVEELETYRRRFTLGSPQNVAITRKNLSNQRNQRPDGFPVLVNAIRKAN